MLSCYIYNPKLGQKRDAQKRLNELLVHHDKGLLKHTGRITVEQHFTNWLEGYVKTNYSQRTYKCYQAIIENQFLPAFGNLPMKQLSPQLVQTYCGKAKGNLTNRTVHHQHRVLSESLKYAIRPGYLGTNPCDMTDPPRPVNKIMRTLTPAEVERLLEVAKIHTITRLFVS